MHAGVVGIKKKSYGYDLGNIISECTFPKANIGNARDTIQITGLMPNSFK